MYQNLPCVVQSDALIADILVTFAAGVIEGVSVSADGALFCSVGDDQAMKVFDVVNFDMINMLRLGSVKVPRHASLCVAVT